MRYGTRDKNGSPHEAERLAIALWARKRNLMRAEHGTPLAFIKDVLREALIRSDEENGLDPLSASELRALVRQEAEPVAYVRSDGWALDWCGDFYFIEVDFTHPTSIEKIGAYAQAIDVVENHSAGSAWLIIVDRFGNETARFDFCDCEQVSFGFFQREGALSAAEAA